MANIKRCDICHKETLWYVDGVTRMGPWANMCPVCYPKVGIGRLGIGLGQQYVWDELTQRYQKDRYAAKPN